MTIGCERPLTAALFASLFFVALLALAPAAPVHAQASGQALLDSLGLDDEAQNGEATDGDATGGATDETSARVDPAAIDARRRELAQRIESLRAEVLRAATPPEEGGETGAPGTDELVGPPQVDDADLERLRWLERVYALLGQQLDEQLRTAEIADQKASLNEADDPESLIGGEAPFDFTDVDRVLDRLDAETRRREVLDDTLADAAEDLDEAASRARDAARERRLAQDQLDEAAGTARELELRRTLETLQLRERASEAEVDLLRQRLANDRAELELVGRRIERLRAAEDWLDLQFQPQQDDLDAVLAALDDEAVELRTRLAALRDTNQAAQSRTLSLQTRLETSDDPQPALRTESSARRRMLDLAQRRQLLLEGRIDRIEQRQRLWRARFELERGPVDDERAREIQTELERLRADFERDRRLAETRLDELRDERRQLKDQLASAEENSAAARWLQRSLDALDETVDAFEAEVSDLDHALDLTRRVRDAHDETAFDPVAFAQRLWTGAQQVWNFEITAVDERPITIGKVVIALLLLVVGYRISKRLAKGVSHLLQSRFGVSAGSAEALQKLAFYGMMVVFFLYALQLVSIPLTVFTVLGGVVAIGVGFGSQNVVNNFISGLILLVERPIKVGDLIDIDGTPGSVERIGLRSVRVRAGNNTHVIVPNSMFLEQKVYNWTVSDDLMRTHVDVGVAYGSPVERVAELMREAMDDEPSIVQSHPREVMFLEFGDNALLFRAYFWIRVHAYLDTYRVQSRLRFRIDRLFRDADLVIAFPQRDVHLDTLSPLRIELLGAGTRGTAAGAARPDAPDTDAPDTDAPDTAEPDTDEPDAAEGSGVTEAT